MHGGEGWGSTSTMLVPSAPTRKNRKDRHHQNNRYWGGGELASPRQLAYFATCSFNGCEEQPQRQCPQNQQWRKNSSAARQSIHLRLRAQLPNSKSVSKHCFTTSFLRLQALVYHILPPSPSTGLPHPSCFSKHWCTTCFLHPQALVYKSSIPKHWFNTSFLHLQALVYNILHPQALVYNILHPQALVYDILHLQALVYDILHLQALVYDILHLQALVYDILHLQALVYDILHLQALVYDILHLQALVYHILPPSPSTGLRYPPSLSTGLRLLPPSPSTVFYPVGRASHLRACLDATLPLSQSWYQNLSEGAYGVGEELRRDKDCPFSGAKIFPTGKKDKSEWRIQFWQSVEEIAGKRCSECLEESAGKRCLECLKEGAGKRCSECAQFPHSKPRFPAPWRKDVVNQSLDFAQLHLPVHTDSGLCYLLHMSLEVRDLASLFNSNRGCIDRPPAPPTPHPLHLRRVCVDLQDCCIRLGNDKKWKPGPTSPFTQSSGVVWKSRWPSWAFRPNEPYGFCGRKATLNRARSTLVTVCP